MKTSRMVLAGAVGIVWGTLAMGQESAPAAPAPAGAERAAAEQAEAPSAFMDLAPATITLGGRAWEDGNVESIGDVLLPVYMTKSGLLFVNPRASFQGEESEMNLGAGFRTLLGDRKMIVGVNGYYDRRETEANNTFDQAGFGVEFLGQWIDARANYYLPEDDIEDASVIEAGTPYEYTVRGMQWERPYGQADQVLQNGTRTETRYRAQPYVQVVRQEQALEGFDCELGVRLPIPVVKDWSDVKVFGGYYSFDNDLTRTIEGWKSRLEVRALPSLLLDAEVFEDEDLNDGKYYVGARLQAPFDIGAWAAGRNPFAGTLAGFKPARRAADRAFDSRLTEMVIRDPRVQVDITDDPEEIRYTVNEILEQNRRRIRDVVADNVTFVDKDNQTGVEDGTFEHPYDSVAQALKMGTDSIYVFDSAKPYRETLFIDKDGQTLIGSGSGIPANGGYRFATGVYPVFMKPALIKDSAPYAMVNVMADRVSISGMEFRGNIQDVIGELLEGGNNPTLTGLAGKEVGLGDLMDIASLAVENSAILALDANELMVTDNIFSDNAAGVLAIYTPMGENKLAEDPHTEHVLLVANNRFEGNLAGLLAVGFDPSVMNKEDAIQPVPLSVGVVGNTFQDNLVGAGIGGLGNKMTVALVDNTFDTDLPVGLGAVVAHGVGDLDAVVVGNTVRGNHTVGMGLIQEQGSMDAIVAGNTFQDCQLASLLVEANAGEFLIDMVDKTAPKYDVDLVLADNTFESNGQDIDLGEWADLLKPEDTVIELPNVPAVFLALQGKNVTVDVSGNSFNGNRGGALLAALMAEGNLNVDVRNNTGSQNRGLFRGNDPDLDWEDFFEGMTAMPDYAFLIAGEAEGDITSSWEGNGFSDSAQMAMFLDAEDIE